MGDTKQVEMRMRKLDEKINRLAHDFEIVNEEIETSKKEIDRLYTILRELKNGEE